MSAVKVCVLILNYQSYQDTIKYVKQLQQQRDIKLSILVVDNDSPNGSYQFLQKELKNIENVEVIKSDKNGGYAYGNNFGLKYIKERDFDYVIISNNDIKVDDPLLIKKLTQKYVELEKVAFIAPVMKNVNEVAQNSAWKLPSLKDDIYSTLRFSRLFLKYNVYYDVDLKSDLPVDCLAGSFFMGSKGIFYEIGLFDENTFLYGEERILAYKVKSKGLQNYLIQSLAYEHLVSGTISSEVNLSRMRKYLFESRYYYHKFYQSYNTNSLKFYYVIYKISKLENRLFDFLKIIIKNVRKR